MENRQNKQYFEGILQLRNCTEKAVSFVRERIDSEKDVHIAKVVETKDGIDFYLNSNKFLKKIGKFLKERFAGITKSSSKLYSVDKQTGKRVYRGTILFRMPRFNIGDIGMFRGDKVKIISINIKVVLQDTNTGKKKPYKFEDVEKHFRAV